MCRHLAYVGREVTLARFVLDAPRALLRQSWEPRHQTSGVVNADGFGVGWYTPTRPEPAVYRRSTPIWSDGSFASIAPTISTTSIVASVRSATPGFPTDESSTPPFAVGRWLFAHNGAVTGFHDGVGVQLRANLSARRAAGIRSTADSEVLFAMVLDRLDGGAAPDEALVAVIADVKGASGGSLNLLLCDGEQVAATAFGNSLFTRTDGLALVASEPLDDEDVWGRVPDLSVVSATPGSVTIDAL